MTVNFLNRLDPFVIAKSMANNLGEVYKKEGSLYRFFYDKVNDGKRAWKESGSLRPRFKDLLKSHILSTLETGDPNFSASAYKVLELGAGFLEGGQTPFSSCLSQADVTFVDLSQEAAKKAINENPSCKYLHLSSTELTKKIPPASIDLIVGCCFLDTLSLQDLLETLKEVSKVLKEGGAIFHVSDLPPYFNALVIDHLEEPDIMFPLIASNYDSLGIQFIPLAACQSFIEKFPTSSDVVFLKDYIALSKDARGGFVIESCHLLENEGFKNVFLTLSNWVVENFSDQRREIINKDYAYKKMEKALKDMGFQILEIGFKNARREENAQPSDKPLNDFCSVMGRTTAVLNNSISPNKTRVTMRVHQIFAKKTSH